MGKTIQQNAVLNAALSYRNRGWSVIPQKVEPGKNGKADKIPLIIWGEFRNRFPEEQEIRAWYEKYPYAGVAIVTGKLSNLLVLDVDKGGDISKYGDLSNTLCASTPSGGKHFYYLYPKGLDIKSSDSKIGNHLDIKAENGLITAPPTFYAGEIYYRWINSPENTPIAQVPETLLHDIKNIEKKRSEPKNDDYWKDILSGVDIGSRNQSATELAGKMLHHLPPEFWEISGWSTLLVWNSKLNKQPLPENELRNTWESIKKAESQKRTSDGTKGDKRTQSDLLVEAINNVSNKVAFFHNESNDPYVRVFIDDHFETWSCKSKMFKRWLSKLFWDAHHKVPNSEALASAINYIEGKACFNAPQINLFNRVAALNGDVWYDIADAKWRAIKLTKDGWSIENEPPILFKRYTHQQAQIIPTTNGDVKLFLKYLNVSEENKKLLLLVWLVSCFIPDFPHPILDIYGAQGSAKSVLSKFLKKLIDPSSMEVSGFTKDPKEIVQLLSHHWCICFDNLSDLPAYISDMLCKAVSGDGFSKRELYSDDNDIIYTFKRCISINGINLIGEKPDLLERSILLELERVPTENRRPEGAFLAEFEADRAAIIGGIFDVLVKAIQLFDSIKLNNLPRMADFTIWGCAISMAMGYTKEAFLKAYYDNLSTQNDEILNEDSVAATLIAFMEDKEIWEGTATKLLEEMNGHASWLGMKTDKDPNWPKAANAFSRRLGVLKTNLAVGGIKITKSEKSRTFIILKVSEMIVNTVTVKEQTTEELL